MGIIKVRTKTPLVARGPGPVFDDDIEEEEKLGRHALTVNLGKDFLFDRSYIYYTMGKHQCMLNSIPQCIVFLIPSSTQVVNCIMGMLLTCPIKHDLGYLVEVQYEMLLLLDTLKGIPLLNDVMP